MYLFGSFLVGLACGIVVLKVVNENKTVVMEISDRFTVLYSHANDLDFGSRLGLGHRYYRFISDNNTFNIVVV